MQPDVRLSAAQRGLLLRAGVAGGGGGGGEGGGPLASRTWDAGSNKLGTIFFISIGDKHKIFSVTARPGGGWSWAR